MCDCGAVSAVVRVRLAALAAQAQAGGYTTMAQAQRAIAPLLDGLELVAWSDPRWIAIPAATATAVEDAVAVARSRVVAGKSQAGPCRGRTVVKGPPKAE